MHNCECQNQKFSGQHVNAFVDLNGIPYLLSEYLDRDTFQQIDRSQLKSEIIIDQSESMRAIVDVSIDDIGKRASDGYPSIIGNNTKQKNLLKMISDNCEIMNHQLNVLRRGIVVRVDYQLENYNTGQVIRTTNESFRILNRSYFLDINPRNTNDNAIIVNFCDTIVSTINEFTHGRDPMMLRVTNIHLSYEMVTPSPKMPRVKQSMTYCNNEYRLPTNYGMENDMYNYHNMMQNRHVMPGCDPVSLVNYDPANIMPSSWSMFNRFYRFDNNGSDIIIHDQEINDPMTKVRLIPCGTVRVNRTFMINPGHRIIFKFCIWKNDVTVVNNTTKVAQCLRAPVFYETDNNCNCDNDCHDHIIDPNYETVMHMLRESKMMNNRQNEIINQLSDKVAELTSIIQTLVPPTTEEPEPIDPPSTDPSCECGCDNNEVVEELEDEIEEINNDISNIQQELESIPNVVPISSEIISDIVEENSKVE